MAENNYSTTSTSMPSWAQPYAEGYLQRAQTTADQAYQPYNGQRTAGFTPWQEQGYLAQAQRAADGSPLMGGAQQALQGMYSAPERGATANPFGAVQASGGGAQVSAPTANNSTVAPGVNPYIGQNNPYLTQQIDQAQGDVVRNWNQVQMPGFDTAMSRGGSFGNANLTSMASQGASDLQRNLGRISGDMRFSDYSQQQQLAEAGLNRKMAADQFNSGTIDRNLDRGVSVAQFNSGLGESAAARALQASMSNAQLGESFASRSDGMYGANQSRLLSALGLAPSFAASDYADIDRLTNAGSAYQGQQQREMDEQYQRFTDARDYPNKQLDIMGNALSRSYGSTTTQSEPGASTAAQAVGGALTFAQLMKLIGG